MRLAGSRASSLRMSASGGGEGIDGSIVEAELQPNEAKLDQTVEDLLHSSPDAAPADVALLAPRLRPLVESEIAKAKKKRQDAG